MALWHTAVISNPGFETGVEDNVFWNVGGGIVCNTTFANSGSHSLLVNTAYSQCMMWREWVVTNSACVNSADKFARVSFYYNDTNAASTHEWVGAAMAIDQNSQFLSYAVGSPTRLVNSGGAWQKWEVDLALPPQTYMVKWFLNKNVGAGLGGLHVDDYALEIHTQNKFVYYAGAGAANRETGSPMSAWIQSSGSAAIFDSQGITTQSGWMGLMWTTHYISNASPVNVYETDYFVQNVEGQMHDLIDAGSAWFRFHFDIRAFHNSVNTDYYIDDTYYGINFISGSDTVIQSVGITAPSGFMPNSWFYSQLYVNTLQMPAATRKIRHIFIQTNTNDTVGRGYWSPLGGISHIELNSPIPVNTSDVHAAGRFFYVASGYLSTYSKWVHEYIPGGHRLPRFSEGYSALTPDATMVDTYQDQYSHIWGVYSHQNAFDGEGVGSRAYITHYRRRRLSIVDFDCGVDFNDRLATGASNKSGTTAAFEGTSVMSISPNNVTFGFDSGRTFTNTWATFFYGLDIRSANMHVEVRSDVFVNSCAANESVFSFGFKPDLIWFTSHGDLFQAGNKARLLTGFIDARSPGGPNGIRGFSLTGWDGAASPHGNYNWNVTLVSTDGWGHVTASQEVDTYPWTFKWNITSITNEGFNFQIESGNMLSTPLSMGVVALSFKWNSTLTNHRVSHFTVTATTAVQTVQTNSLIPRYMVSYASGNAIGYANTPDDGTRGSQLVRGYWLGSNTLEASTQTVLIPSVASQDPFNGISSYFMSFIENASLYYAHIGSIAVTSNHFSFMVTGSPGGVDSMDVVYMAIGDVTPAPNHFMGPEGQSVFLTNQQFGDDLLLGGADASSGGGGPSSPPPPATGNPLQNREFWTDANRQFPTQVNTIRDFPIY